MIGVWRQYFHPPPPILTKRVYHTTCAICCDPKPLHTAWAHSRITTRFLELIKSYAFSRTSGPPLYQERADPLPSPDVNKLNIKLTMRVHQPPEPPLTSAESSADEDMADKITDVQVNDLLRVLRAEVPIDTKVAQVTAIKSGIKQHNVPDNCVAPLFEALRSASASQHAVLVNAGFTALNHLLTRLSRQEPKFIAKEAARTLPLIVEKMGDPKEKFRTLALQCMVTIWLIAPADAERFIRNTAMVGKNPRAKELSLQWLLQVCAVSIQPWAFG